MVGWVGRDLLNKNFRYPFKAYQFYYAPPGLIFKKTDNVRTT